MRSAKAAALLFFALVFSGISSSFASWVPNGIEVCTTTGNYGRTPMISDGAGGAIVAWWDYRDGICYDVYAQRIGPTGDELWTAGGTAICTSAGYRGWFLNLVGRLNVAPDGSGGAIIMWSDYRNGIDWDIYAQRVDANGTALWTAEGVAVCKIAGDQTALQAAPEGSGGAIIAWCDRRNGVDFDIYAQRIDSGGNATWVGGGVAICAAAGNQGDLRLVSDASGGAVMTWSDNRGGSGDIYAQKVDANGNAVWTADGRAVCTAASNQQMPDLISDGAGGGIIAWSDYRSGTADIYAARVSAAGTQLWTPNGVAVCTASADQGAPHIAPDQTGGAFISWSDNRGANSDIYAQRVDASGSVLWAGDGVGVCAVSGDQGDSPIIPDGSGGAIIAWLNVRVGTVDVYAQKIDGDGNVRWASSGVPICMAAGQHEYIRIVPDGVGGAILLWYYFRSGVFGDLYAQRVDAAGHTVVATLLRDYSAVVSEGGITVSWALSEIDEGVEFAISRATDSEGPFTELSSSLIVRENLSFAFMDESVEPGAIYRYRVEICTGPERRELFRTDPLAIPAMPLTLFQNYPNPFNPSTVIRYYVPTRCNVRLGVYDVRGELVRMIEEGSREKGAHSVAWGGRDGNGMQAASGVYFCRLSTGKERLSRKMVFVR